MEIVTTIVDYVPETLFAKVQLQPVGLDVDTGQGDVSAQATDALDQAKCATPVGGGDGEAGSGKKLHGGLRCGRAHERFVRDDSQAEQQIIGLLCSRPDDHEIAIAAAARG